MQNETVAAIAKVSPPVAGNFWLWLTSHDINWWVAAATFVYVVLQMYVLARDKIVNRKEKESQ